MKNGPNELWFRHVIFFLEGLSENIIKDRGKKFCLNFGCRVAYYKIDATVDPCIDRNQGKSIPEFPKTR